MTAELTVNRRYRAWHKDKINPFLFFGLLFSVISSFDASNVLKAASLLFCLLYIFFPATRFRKYQFTKLEFYLLLAYAVGMLFSWRNDSLDIIRDMLLFLIPCVYFMVGRRYVDRNGNIRNLIYYFTVLYCAVFFLVLSLVWYFIGFADILEIRTSVSSGGFLLVYCIYFIYRDKKSWQRLVSQPLFLAPVAVFLLQLSRTFSFIILMFLLYPRSKGDAARTFVYSALLLMFLALVAAQFGFHELIIEAIGKWFSEISFQENWTEADLGINFRGYETAMAYATFISYEPVNMIFGGGFGSLVRLDIPAFLAGNEYESIPLLHNGYLYLLIKMGIVGMVFYSFFFAEIYLFCSQHLDRENRILVKVTIIGLLASNFLVSSFFNNESAFAYLLLGYFCNPWSSKKSQSDVL